jgi:hypothetical protein
MATIIHQMMLFDYDEIEVLGDLERLALALAGLDDEALMRRLEKRRGQGRNDYPIRVMWNCIIAMIVFGHKTVASFRRELSRNSQLRRIVGLDDGRSRKHLVPPNRVFTRFMKLLASEVGSLEAMFKDTVAKLLVLIPEFGKDLAGDGKYFDSYAKGKKEDGSKEADKRGEHDAEWSTKTYTYTGNDGKQHEKKEYHFGFKGHIICDVATGLPVMFNMTAANADEKAEMINMLAKMPDELCKKANTLALDRGYDSTDMIKAIKAVNILPVVDIRNCWKNGDDTRQYKNTDIIYDYKGTVYYVKDDGTKVKMTYEGYDRQKKCLRYSHQGKIYKLYVSYDERVFLPIARDSLKFKRLYKGRTSVERLNGRLDRDFMFEDSVIRGIGKMKTFLALSLVIMNAMAVAKIEAGQTENLAAMTKGLSKAA